MRQGRCKPSAGDWTRVSGGEGSERLEKYSEEEAIISSSGDSPDMVLGGWVDVKLSVGDVLERSGSDPGPWYCGSVVKLGSSECGNDCRTGDSTQLLAWKYGFRPPWPDVFRDAWMLSQGSFPSTYRPPVLGW